MKWNISGRFTSAEHAQKAVRELAGLNSRSISISGPAATANDINPYGEPSLIVDAAFGVGTDYSSATLTPVSGPPFDVRTGNPGVQSLLETGNEVYFDDVSSKHAVKPAQIKQESTIISVKTHEHDVQEVKQIIEAHGGIASVNTSPDRNRQTDSIYTEAPINPYTAKGYIDPNFGSGNFSITDQLPGRRD